MSNIISIRVNTQENEQLNKLMQTLNLQNIKQLLFFLIDYYNNSQTILEKINQINKDLDKKLDKKTLNLLSKSILLKREIKYLNEQKRELEQELENLHNIIDNHKLKTELYNVLQLNREFYNEFDEKIIKQVIERLDLILQKLNEIEIAEKIRLKRKTKVIEKW